MPVTDVETAAAAAQTRPSAAREAPDRPAAIAFLSDPESLAVVRSSFADLQSPRAEVKKGGIADAIEELPRLGWPKLLIVDISGVAEPMLSITRLAEVSDPRTEVVVVGEQNDVVLYRSLKGAGVAEYFFKPLSSHVLNRTLASLSTGSGSARPSHTGRLIFVLGARGGVGATTLATNLAWHFAEELQRGVLFLDLDLRMGDAAFQFDVTPNHALREILEDPGRLDDLFLERGLIHVTEHLGMLAGLEPLLEHPALQQEALSQVLKKLLNGFRYVIVDLPVDVALSFPALLHLSSTLLLVSDSTVACVREIQRWRDALGPNTPDRTILHILNKGGAQGAIPLEEMLTIIPAPDLTLAWDPSVMGAGMYGTRALHEESTVRNAMAALSRLISGARPKPRRSLWQRVFG